MILYHIPLNYPVYNGTQQSDHVILDYLDYEWVLTIQIGMFVA